MAGITAIFAAKDKISPTLLKIASKTDKTNKNFSNLGSTVKRTMSVFGGLYAIQKGMQGIKLGILNNVKIEQATVAWETLLGSQEKANKMMKDITAYAAKTPFTKMGVEYMAKQLNNAGFQGETMFKQLDKIGDLGGAFGIGEDSLKEMVRQYAQVQQATVAYTEDLNILQDRGIPIYKAIAKTQGIAVKDVKKLASQGKITAKIYNKAIDSMAKKTKGAMEKQSKTLGGMWSTFKDTIDNIAGIVTEPIFDFFKTQLEDVNSAMSGIDWESVGNKLSGTIKNIIDTGIELKDFFVSELIPRFADIGSKLSDLANTYFPSTGDGFDGLKQKASELVIGGLDAVKLALQWIIDNKDTVKLAIDAMALAYTAHAVAVGISKGALIASNIVMVASTLISWGLSAAIVALYLKDYICTAAHWGLVAAQWALNAAMSANPITIVILLVAGLVAGFIYAYKHSEKFRTGVQNMWKALKSGAETAINFVIKMLNKMIGLINKIPGVDIGTVKPVDFTGNKTIPTKKYAKGTNYHPGGDALVGEAGMELVTGPKFGDLPAGSKVYNAKDTKDMLNNKSGNNYYFTFDVTGEGDKKSIAEYCYNYFESRLEEEILLGGNS